MSTLLSGLLRFIFAAEKKAHVIMIIFLSDELITGKDLMTISSRSGGQVVEEQ